MVSAEHYERMDVQEDNAEGNEEGEEVWVHEYEDAISLDSDSSDDEDDEENELGHWAHVMDSAIDGENEYRNILEGSDNSSESEEDDPYETRDKNLAPLPEDNDLSIPQENNLYFSRKQYVRNDKYTLASMLGNKDIELPSIMSAYGS
jgi:hypothetical protein